MNKYVPIGMSPFGPHYYNIRNMIVYNDGGRREILCRFVQDSTCSQLTTTDMTHNLRPQLKKLIIINNYM